MRSIVMDEKLLIINLHMEEVFNPVLMNPKLDVFFSGNDSMQIKEGIYVDDIKQTTYDSILRGFPDINGYKVCLDWEHIRNNVFDSLDVLVKLVNHITSKGNTVDFACSDQGCLQQIKNVYSKNYFVNKDRIHICDENEIKDYKEEYDRILNKIIRAKIKECCEDYNRISESSPVKLKYYINIKPIIEDINLFCNMMYKLAISMREHIDTYCRDNNKSIALVVTSLNGETVGAILAQLFGFDVIKIDHLGPRNELFINSLERFIDREKEYYIISDVICMGREVKAAESIINMYGATCRGYITVVNVVPTGEKAKNVHCLVNIDKSNNDDIGYKIFVDL